jgi:cobalt-zinc-cadmium efflux system outer membrane protein
MFQASKRLMLAVLISAALPAQAACAALEGPLISLSEARSRALASNPDLEAARSAAAAAGGALRQARAWPNPELGVDAEEVGGDRPGWDEAEVTWSLSQRLDLFGARRARSRAALHGRDAASLSVDVAQLDLLAEVDRRFADALAAQWRMESLEASDSLAVETLRAVTALVDAGEVSPIEVDRAEAERAMVATRVLTARFEHAGALRSLAQLWGSLEPDFSAIEGSLEITPYVPERDSLYAAAPEIVDLRRADAEVRRAEATAALAGRERLPEVALRGGFKQFNASNEQSYVGGLVLSLPLFDRKGGALQEARGRLAEARAERAALRSRIALARATAYDALAVALETSRSLREVSLPRAQAVHASVQEGYRRGKFGLLDLIDAGRFLLQIRLEYIDALRSVWVARADLVRLMRQGSAPSEGESR